MKGKGGREERKGREEVVGRKGKGREEVVGRKGEVREDYSKLQNMDNLQRLLRAFPIVRCRVRTTISELPSILPLTGYCPGCVHICG